MKRLRHLALCLLLTLSTTANAFAAEIPESFHTENLNGQQRLVKTYTLSPDIDPETLKEPSFEYDGFTYTWAYTTKEEHSSLKTKDVTELVTVETAKNDLSQILAKLPHSMEYDDGQFTGTLSMDHTTLVTTTAGYTTRYSKTSETKVIGNLDRNDMSYVPATTVKNGKTLALDNVDWQVTGTALVGETLVPSLYQAVATYSASSSYQAATGYITTVEYRGEAVSEGLDDITYTVVYTGTEIEVPEAEPETPKGVFLSAELIFWLAVIMLSLLLLGLILYLVLNRRNVYVYIPGSNPRDYKLAAKFHVTSKNPCIDVSEVNPYPSDIIAIEVKKSLARKLLGKDFTVFHGDKTYVYRICQNRAGDWHELKIEPVQGVQP